MISSKRVRYRGKRASSRKILLTFTESLLSFPPLTDKETEAQRLNNLPTITNLKATVQEVWTQSSR